ncbi:PTC1 [Symbiodinium sp. CCMP2592]|nr:PTC1 [Symbiodinium sp. CCMP2592]
MACFVLLTTSISMNMTGIYLAVDGMHESDAQVRALVSCIVAQRLQDKAPEILIQAALRAGSTDNTTALVAFFGSGATGSFS